MVKIRMDFRDSITAAGLFCVTLAIYLRCLCPTVYWGDCGELATAAYTLGNTHPTGYPVWCLLAKTWTVLIPIGTIIWRLNTMSAFCGALGVACLFGAGRYLGLPRVISAGVSGLFAFSATFWQQCEFAETYSLTACYTCLMLLLALRWHQTGYRPSALRLLAVAYGFALTNHLTNMLFLPGFIVFILWVNPELRGLRRREIRRQWAQTLVCGIAPLLFYAYLPLRALAKPAANWGDPSTPFRFYYHITGRLYSSFMFHSSTAQVAGHLKHWAAGLGGEYAWGVIAFAAFGIIAAWRKPVTRPAGWLLSWILLANVAYAINYDIYNIYIYFIPSYIVFALAVGFGVDTAWNHLVKRIDVPKRPLFTALAATAFVVMVPLQIMAHWKQNDLSRNTTCYDYGHNILASVPHGGLLIDNGKDTGTSVMEYLQNVEGYRTDVLVVMRLRLGALYLPVYRQWGNMWYLGQLMHKDREAARLYRNTVITPRAAVTNEPLRNLIADAVKIGRPVAVLDAEVKPNMIIGENLNVGLDEYLKGKYEMAAAGLVTRIYPLGHAPSPQFLLSETQRVMTTYRVGGVYEGMYLNDDFLTWMAVEYANADLSNARLAASLGQWRDAAASYQNVLRLFQSAEATDGLSRCRKALGEVAQR